MEPPVESDVRSFVLDELRLLNTAIPESGAITDGTPLGDGGLDMESLYVMQLVMRLEQHYQLTLIDDAGALKSLTFGGLVRCVTTGVPVAAKEGTHP